MNNDIIRENIEQTLFKKSKKQVARKLNTCVLKNSECGRSNCLTGDALILTPFGEVRIENLNEGDMIKVSNGKKVRINKIFKRVIRKPYDGDCLYIIPDGYISENIPHRKLFISSDHLFRMNNRWTCASIENLETVEPNEITFYNLLLDNYYTDFPIANGVIIDSMQNEEESIFHIEDGNLTVRTDYLTEEQINFMFM